MCSQVVTAQDADISQGLHALRFGIAVKLWAKDAQLQLGGRGRIALALVQESMTNRTRIYYTGYRLLESVFAYWDHWDLHCVSHCL